MQDTPAKLQVLLGVVAGVVDPDGTVVTGDVGVDTGTPLIERLNWRIWGFKVFRIKYEAIARRRPTKAFVILCLPSLFPLTASVDRYWNPPTTIVITASPPAIAISKINTFGINVETLVSQDVFVCQFACDGSQVPIVVPGRGSRGT